jgi:hypothetical protein
VQSSSRGWAHLSAPNFCELDGRRQGWRHGRGADPRLPVNRRCQMCREVKCGVFFLETHDIYICMISYLYEHMYVHHIFMSISEKLS